MTHPDIHDVKIDVRTVEKIARSVAKIDDKIVKSAVRIAARIVKSDVKTDGRIERKIVKIGLVENMTIAITNIAVNVFTINVKKKTKKQSRSRTLLHPPPSSPLPNKGIVPLPPVHLLEPAAF
jgi:hypothetical protein